jgi:glutamyl-tRNA reductase
MYQINHFKLITLTHKSMHLEEIGEFHLTESEENSLLEMRLKQIQTELGMRELMYLATCNRVLFFFISDENIDGQSFYTNFFQVIYKHLDSSQQKKAMLSAFAFEGKDAISHLFEVAASMDSMVVGEREILRQLRETYEKNVQMGLCSDAIRIAMRFAVEAAKKVYTFTKIGEKPVSIVSLAMQKMNALELEKNAPILLIGAGQTNRLVVKFLMRQGFSNVSIYNRNQVRAEKLAKLVKGFAYGLDQLHKHAENFRVVFAATASPEIILSKELYDQIGSTNEKCLLIDLSIPANIDKEISQKSGVEYLPIENLRELAQENLSFREKELIAAKKLINEYVNEFEIIFQERQIEIALRDVPEQIKAIREHALQNVFKNEVSALDEETRALMDKVLRYMEKRCIAIPLQVAKEKLVRSEIQK